MRGRGWNYGQNRTEMMWGSVEGGGVQGGPESGLNGLQDCVLRTTLDVGAPSLRQHGRS